MEALWKFCLIFGIAIGFVFPLAQARIRNKQFRCPRLKFKCATEKCIPAIWKCDGDDDCGDGSDENGCSKKKCRAGVEFACGNQKCIPKRWRCDGEKDCSDGSDERDCPPPTCAKEFFKCNNSKCVPNRWKCDRQDDCGDKSDENEASCPDVPGTCDKDKDVKCPDGTCISSTWKCDGENDCKDGSDERNCTAKIRKCKMKEYTCMNKQCIPKRWRCDGSTDCYDNSDERNCQKLPPKTCGRLFWTCENGDCIKKDWRCDGEGDCRDSSDEKNCTNINCALGKFKCISENKCIPKKLRCDNRTDCADGSDELKCSTSKINCGPTDFNCSRHECVSSDKVCDSIKDCLNGEDEPPNCNINECLDRKGHCSHNCTDLPVGYKCSCPKGYQLDNDGRTCTDIDECKVYGTCHQVCANTKGHYKCSCAHGYKILSDRKSCKAEGMKEWIYFSNRVDIRRVSANGKNYEIVVSNIRGAVSIDFDMKRKRIYWTDILSDQIQSAQIDGGSPRVIYTGGNKTVVMKHVHTPDGLAFDWINDKLYWTDTGYKTVEVSDLDGKNNMDIVEVGLNEPRAISVDPLQGYVYWTDWGSSASIERISMDGNSSTREKIVDKNINWPNGLTLDLNQGKVYWIDAKLKRMEVADLDGKNRMIIKRTGFRHPFSIDNFADQVYWTDWKSDKLSSMSKFDASRVNIIKNGLFAPMDVKVFHKSKQPPGENRCGVDKNGCSHLCLLANRDGKPSASCKCPRGMTLSGIRTCIGKHKPHGPKQTDVVNPAQRTKAPVSTQSIRKQITTGSPIKHKFHGGLGGGENHPANKTIRSGGNIGTGTIIAILLSILVVILILCGFIWYKRRHVGKTNVKYYKDMSKKPLEDDFDVGQEDMDDMAQISSNSYIES